MVKFNLPEFPYETLSKVGLTREMVEDLPERVLEDLEEGFLSPIVPISFKKEKENDMQIYARFSFIRLPNDKVEAVFYPRFSSIHSRRYTFTEEETKSLSKGKTLILNDSEYGKSFIQADPFTNSIIISPVNLLDTNFSVVENEMYLTLEEKEKLRKGERVTVVLKGEATTACVDLSRNNGLRVVPGQEDEWLKRHFTPEALSKFNFGINGCWVKRESGEFDYVEEDKYTDEMWAAMRKNSEFFRQGFKR